MEKYRITVEEIHEDGTTDTRTWEGPNALVCMNVEKRIIGCIQNLSAADIAEMLANNKTLSEATLFAASMLVKSLMKVAHLTEE